MNDLSVLVLAGGGGLLLGVVFFGGLWWTVQRGLTSSSPVRWFVGGSLVRVGVALPGFYVLGRDDWRRWVAGLAGFFVARALSSWFARGATHGP